MTTVEDGEVWATTAVHGSLVVGGWMTTVGGGGLGRGWVTAIGGRVFEGG